MSFTPSTPHFVVSGNYNAYDPGIWAKLDYSFSPIPPIHIITNGFLTKPGNEANEDIVARYPMAIVSQAQVYTYIKSVNPSIKLMAYLQVTDELTSTASAGPGNDILKACTQDGTFVKKNGVEVTYALSGVGDVRVRDTTSAVWQAAFLDACTAIFNAYPFEGLFLDNCYNPNYWGLSGPTITTLRNGLKDVLDQLRALYPSKLIIGNGASYQLSTPVLAGLNGAMTERTASRIVPESGVVGYTSPLYNLFADYVPHYSQLNSDQVLTNMQLAINNKMSYSVSLNDFSSWLWPQYFADVVAAYNSQH